jgi:hypothetical protein
MLVDGLLKDQLGEDLPQFLPAREHADGQDFYELGIDSWYLLLADIASDAFLDKIEGGNGWRPPEADLNHLDQKVPKRHNCTHS